MWIATTRSQFIALLSITSITPQIYIYVYTHVLENRFLILGFRIIWCQFCKISFCSWFLCFALTPAGHFDQPYAINAKTKENEPKKSVTFANHNRNIMNIRFNFQNKIMHKTILNVNWLPENFIWILNQT